jgi:hypothetical protein
VTAFAIIPGVYGLEGGAFAGPWLLTETLAMLTHLERSGEVTRLDGEPQRWALAN